MKINNLLITGGSGTLGNELTRILYNQCQRITIYSRTETKQEEMRLTYPEYPDNKMRYILGDICDTERLSRVMQGHDVVIHAAAMKFVDRAEYNVEECIRINVDGTMSVAKACATNNVADAMFVSSDKAVASSTVYGTSKALGEKIWTNANNLSHTTLFNAVRYGNVVSSSGSVFPKWKALIEKGKNINLTHEDMTRYFWTKNLAATFLIESMAHARTNKIRGAVYVSKMQSYRMYDIAKSMTFNTESQIEITGIRAMEKIHEDLISEHESITCTYNDGYFMVYPVAHDWTSTMNYIGTKVPYGYYEKSCTSPSSEIPCLL